MVWARRSHPSNEEAERVMLDASTLKACAYSPPDTAPGFVFRVSCRGRRVNGLGFSVQGEGFRVRAERVRAVNSARTGAELSRGRREVICRFTRIIKREVRLVHLQLVSLDCHGAAVAFAPRCMKPGVRDSHARETIRHDRPCRVQRDW